MLKPNIRGFNKRTLHFGLRGWRIEGEDSTIQHRLPWRRSWVEQIATDETLTPVLARSGQVHLIYSDTKSTNEPVARTGAKYMLPLVAFAMVLIFVVTMLLPSAQPNPAQPVSQCSAGEVACGVVEVDQCATVLQNPEAEVTKWLTGLESKTAKITEEQRVLLGGLQLRKVRVTCGTHSQKLKLTLSQTAGAWQLKKFARLED